MKKNKKAKITIKTGYDRKTQIKLKKQSYSSSLTNVRKRLNPGYRTMSNVTQSKLGNRLTDAASKTIGLSYALVGGALLALISTAVVFHYADSYGYTFNTMIIIYSFIAGYLVTYIVGFIYKKFK